MTAANGIKRLGIAIVAVTALGVAALAGASLLIPAENVREAVAGEIRAAMGLDPILRGQVSVSLFPSGTVTFNDVSLGGPDGAPALTAERIVARLRFFPLFAGRFEIADISLERPTISVSIDASGRSNWTAHVEALARSLRPEPGGRGPAFSEIRISDGTIVIRDDARNLVETLSRVDLALAWPSISRSFGTTGRLFWHGEPVDIALTLGDFAAALSGERSGLKVRLTGAPVNFAFDGSLSARPTLRMEGVVTADAPSLRKAMAWTGHTQPPGGGFGRFAINANATVANATVALNNVNVELDGNVAEGVLSFAIDGRQTLQGTLATENLDLTSYVSAVRVLTANDRDWNRLPIALQGLHGTDLDIRLSAAKVNVNTVKLGRTAVAASLRNGQFTVTVGESQAFNGIIQGFFTVADLQGGADIKAQLQFTGVDLEQCLGEMFGIRRLEGTGNIGFAVEASGASVFALARTLNGTANVTGRKGAVIGVSVETMLRGIERLPLGGGGNFRSGRTAFDSLAISMKIAHGRATVEDVRLESPALRLAMAGSASIPDRDIDLKGTARLFGAGGFDLPIVVQGPWDNPLMSGDPESLISRSGAAAPLIDSLRNRSTREAVRSAIDRLTGRPPADVTPAAEPAAGGR